VALQIKSRVDNGRSSSDTPGYEALMQRQIINALLPFHDVNANHRRLVRELDCRNNRVQLRRVEIALKMLARLANPQRASGLCACRHPNRDGIQANPAQRASVQASSRECATMPFAFHREPQSGSRRRSRCMSFSRPPAKERSGDFVAAEWRLRQAFQSALPRPHDDRGGRATAGGLALRSTSSSRLELARGA